MGRTQKLYRKGLDSVEGMRLFDCDLKGGELPLWVDAIVGDRDALESHLSKNGMGCRRFWFPLHTQKPYQLPNGGFPNSTSLAPKAIWLPSSFDLTDDDVGRVCDSIREFLRK
jgi:perosamine synthetase